MHDLHGPLFQKDQLCQDTYLGWETSALVVAAVAVTFGGHKCVIQACLGPPGYMLLVHTS